MILHDTTVLLRKRTCSHTFLFSWSYPPKMVAAAAAADHDDAAAAAADPEGQDSQAAVEPPIVLDWIFGNVRSHQDHCVPYWRGCNQT